LPGSVPAYPDCRHAVGIGLHLERFVKPANGIDLDHSANLLELWAYLPLQDRPQLHRVANRPAACAAAADLELQHFAQGGCERTHFGRAVTGKQLSGGPRETLVDELAGRIDVRPVLNDQPYR